MNYMNNYFLLLFFTPALFLIFFFTKAQFIQFLLGFGLCLLAEIIFIACYCLFKMQEALLDSTRIKLEQNYELQPQIMFPFKQKKTLLKLFLNRFTQEEKLQTKKNSVKITSFENYLSEQDIISQEPKTQIMKYMQQKKNQYQILNIFNQTLTQFGKKLLQVQQKGIIFKKVPIFQSIQNGQQCELPPHELQNFQRQILDDGEIKIKINKEDPKNIMIPSWSTFLEGINSIGEQFKKIEDIQNSNQEMFNMVNKKILQDFDFIQHQIKNAFKSLTQIQKKAESLKKQNQQFLSAERNNASVQMDVVFFVKKQYYKFQDFQMRIKENQKNYNIQTKKLAYYREKLASFQRKNMQKYDKILTTRFFALLDSYNITIEESLIKMRKMFLKNHIFSQIRPPKVNKIAMQKNMNLQVDAQMIYQKQYFKRAIFYSQKADNFLNSLKQINSLIMRLKQPFQFMKYGLHTCKQKYDKNQRSFNLLFLAHFNKATSRFLAQIKVLEDINSKMLGKNQTYLKMCISKINNSMETSQKILSELKIYEAPIQYKYKHVKDEIQQIYNLIQNQIKEIKKFEQIYKLHSNRIKKILIIGLLNLLNLQKGYLNQSDFMKKNYEGVEQHKEQNQQEKKEENGIKGEQILVDNIHTGYYLGKQYVSLLNKFLFAAYNQWKDSQFFKETMSKELYILLNKEQNESLTQVTIQKMEFSGYPPEILWVKELYSEPFQFLADLSIAFKGKWSNLLKTQYKLIGLNVPAQVTVQLQQLYCVVRLCFVPSQVGQSWFTFIGQPVAKFNITPKIYDMTLKAQTIKNFFANFLLKKLKQSTFPTRQSIKIPVSKQDLELQKIQKRFKAMYNY